MPFENGSVSFRIYDLPQALPEDVVDCFAQHAALPIDASMEQSCGWVTGRHLLDNDIRPETAMFAGYLCLTLRVTERKVPSTLLQAECKMEELAIMSADGRDYLRAQERKEIKRMVTERLLPDMPPQIKGYPMVCHPEGPFIYSGALSQAQNDLFTGHFIKATKITAFPCTPEKAAMTVSKIDHRHFTPASFSPRIDDAAMDVTLGRDFLTWLLYKMDNEPDLTLADGTAVSLLIEGPLTFVHEEGKGAHVTVLRKGEPVSSAETGTCLINGKKLKVAKLALSLSEEAIWQCTLDADEFIFKGVKLPDPEEGLDRFSRFQDRIMNLDKFRELFFGLFDLFLKERIDPPQWSRTRKAMREWVEQRAP